MAAANNMALTARRAAFNNPSKVTRQQIPPFLDKLYHMVNDSSTDSLIRWSDTGDSFYVVDHERFAKEVLPRWFKHQKFGSFVRQLNNYGFRKIPHLQQGSLQNDAETEKSNFEHPNFQRGQADLLCLIQRKKTTAANDGQEEHVDVKDGGETSDPAPNNASSASSAGPVLDINGLINSFQTIKRHQLTISSELKDMHASNQALWQEAYAARERHKTQNDTINKILKFLAGVFGNGRTPREASTPRDSDLEESSTAVVRRVPRRLMIEQGDKSSNGPSDPAENLKSMEPLDYDGGQTGDASARFATIETEPSPQPCSPKREEDTPRLRPIPGASIEDILPSPGGTADPNYVVPAFKGRQSPVPSSLPQSSEFMFPPDSSALATNSNAIPDPILQAAVAQLLNNPAQLQRFLYSWPPNQMPQMPLATDAVDPSAAFTSPMGIDAMPSNSVFHDGRDSMGSLAENIAQLDEASRANAQNESNIADMQSLIDKFNLDPQANASLLDGAVGLNGMTDPSSSSGDAKGPGFDPAGEVDLAEFLKSLGADGDIINDPDGGSAAPFWETNAHLGPPSAAFLDEVNSVSGSEDLSPALGFLDGGSAHPSKDADGRSKKRRSDAAGLGDSADRPPSSRLRTS